MNNEFLDLLLSGFRSNSCLSLSSVIGAILAAFAIVENMHMKIKINTNWGKETSIGSILMSMIRFALALVSIPMFCIGVYFAGVNSNPNPPAVDPPDPKIAAQSQTLKMGDEIVVVNAPRGLQKWEDPTRKRICKGSAEDGDIGKVKGIVVHDDGYLMHFVEWGNGDKNWVSQNDPKCKNEVYLETRFESDESEGSDSMK